MVVSKAKSAAGLAERGHYRVRGHPVVRAVEPEVTGREVDDGNSAARLNAPDDVTREGAAVVDMVQHRSHVDRPTAVVREVCRVRRSLDDADIGSLRTGGGVGDCAATVRIEFRREHFPTRSEKLRHGHGVRSVAGAEIGDPIALLNSERLDELRRLTGPPQRQDKQCEMRRDGN